MKSKFLLLYIFVVFGLHGLWAKDTFQLRFDNGINFTLLYGPENKSDYFASNRDYSYNFNNQPPVTLLLDPNQLKSLNAIQPTINLYDSNSLDNTSRLKQHISLTPNQTLVVYDAMGNPIKTISTSNSLYIAEHICLLANRFYDFVLPHISFEPLKFVIAH